ncbi:hypothetical protein ACFLUG_04175 [Chloroflexota bacterium]
MSQGCVEADELITNDEIMECTTEDFLGYIDDLSEKIVILRHLEQPGRGLLVRPCDSSRYFEGGQWKTKKNIQARFGDNYTAPGTFVTLTYDHEKYTRWEAWERVAKDIKRFLHNITMRYKRAGRKSSPRYIWVIEEQSKTGYPHVHIFYPRLHWLLAKEDIQALWGVGRTRIEAAKGVNVGRYICKYITKMGGWSDEAMAFIWRHKIRMYGYSRKYSLPVEDKTPGDWMFIKMTNREHLNFYENLGMLLISIPDIDNIEDYLDSS